jgi:hypothetical protein
MAMGTWGGWLLCDCSHEERESAAYHLTASFHIYLAWDLAHGLVPHAFFTYTSVEALNDPEVLVLSDSKSNWQ